jgi:hypothetical protein
MLMKKEIDLLIYSNKWLDNFLIWLNIKSESAYLTNDKKAAIRAFYFDLACRPHLFYIIEDVVPSSFTESLKKYYNFLFLNIEPEFNILRHIQTALDVRLIKIIGSLSQDFVSNLDLDEAIEFSNIINCIDELHELLQNIKKIKNQYNNELKDSVHQIIKFQKYVWLEKLNSLLIKYRNIDYNLQFTQEQCKLLETYYNSNLLLVECLNTDSKVSPEVRSHIEDTLLLPIEEIEKRPFKN